jgi:uncharacterized protein RhaS with RHS repeats
MIARFLKTRLEAVTMGTERDADHLKFVTVVFRRVNKAHAQAANETTTDTKTIGGDYNKPLFVCRCALLRSTTTAKTRLPLRTQYPACVSLAGLQKPSNTWSLEYNV